MEIDCQSVKAKLDDASDIVLLDCREQSEWETVRIDGAVLLPMSELRDRVGELEQHRGKEIIVYCHHGVRSMSVAGWLKQNGYPGVVSMAGGIDAWAENIDPGMSRY